MTTIAVQLKDKRASSGEETGMYESNLGKA